MSKVYRSPTAYAGRLRQELIQQFFHEKVRPNNPLLPTKEAIGIARDHANNTIEAIYDTLMSRDLNPQITPETIRKFVDGHRSPRTGKIMLDALQSQLIVTATNSALRDAASNPQALQHYPIATKKIRKAIAAMPGDSTPTPQVQSITHQGHGIASPLLDPTSSLLCR